MNDERGYSMIELLVGVSIFAIVAVGLSLSSTTGYKIINKTKSGDIATQLAKTKIESLLASGISALSSSNNLTETNLASGGYKFSRVTTVTSPTITTRLVSVTVTPSNITNTTVTLTRMASLPGGR